MNWLGRVIGRAYERLWFATEFRLTPINRRPFTFWLRDLIYPHMPWFVAIVVAFLAGMIVLSYWYNVLATILVFIGAGVTSHLVWGEPYLEKQQEVPPYLGE